MDVGRRDQSVDWDERFRALYGFAPHDPATPERVDPARPRRPTGAGDRAARRDHDVATRDSWENTFRIVRPDGTVVWIQSRGRADRDADGKITRLSGLDLDFSQHQRTSRRGRRAATRNTIARCGRCSRPPRRASSRRRRGLIATANQAFEAMFGWPPAI